MSYTFVEVKSKVDGKQYWLFKPKDTLQIIEHWYKYPASVIREGTRFLVRKQLSGRMSHCCNDFERAVEASMFTLNLDLRSALVKVENEAFQSRMTGINNNEIYLNHGMQVIILDERFLDIVNSVEKESLTFPDEEKPTIDKVKIISWTGGIHYYAKIGSIDVVDKYGNQKWNTREEALEASNWFIKENWKDERSR